MMRKLLAVFIICMVLSAGCAPGMSPRATSRPAPTPRPTSVFDLLGDSTCAKPCVFGITPGLTTRAQAWTILQNNKHVPHCVQDDANSSAQSIRLYINCDYQSSTPITVGSYHADGVVDSFGAVLANVSLEQLLARYGPPDDVHVILMSGDTASSGPEVRVQLLYWNMRAEVYLPVQFAAQYEVSPQTPVYSVTFVSERSLADDETGGGQAWHGYGVYGP